MVRRDIAKAVAYELAAEELAHRLAVAEGENARLTRELDEARGLVSYVHMAIQAVELVDDDGETGMVLTISQEAADRLAALAQKDTP